MKTSGQPVDLTFMGKTAFAQNGVFVKDVTVALQSGHQQSSWNMSVKSDLAAADIISGSNPMIHLEIAELRSKCQA